MPGHVLITNDDGIGSGFLRALAEALAGRFRITIAAPAREQSWIGRAVSRRRAVRAERHPELPWPAWTIDGTPTDCVNIALGNLLGTLPDAVVSGINIGYNTSTPLLYSSGTVAGAMEGAFWGLPAFAVSQEVPDELFEEATRRNGHLPPGLSEILHANARHAAGLIERLMHGTSDRSDGSDRSDRSESRDAIVHNLNYPAAPRQPYETVLTAPVPLREMGFFRPGDEGCFSFHFQHGTPLPCGVKTDREALAAGEVSHSILNFSRLGRDLNG